MGFLSFALAPWCSCRREDVVDESSLKGAAPSSRRDPMGAGPRRRDEAEPLGPHLVTPTKALNSLPQVELMKEDSQPLDAESLPQAWEADEDFDAAHVAAGPTFSEAWHAFKAQEELGFGKLREYVAANYPALLRKILSPEREAYSLQQLGPRVFPFRGRTVRREDYSIKNERGFDLACSLWRNGDEDDAPDASLTAETKRTYDRGDLVRLHCTAAAKRKQWLVGRVVSQTGRRLVRVDFEGQTVELAHSDLEFVPRRTWCVVYVHDVGGSRLASLSSLGVALDSGISGYCAFDTTACGHAGGRHISFGHYERYDVAAVVADLVRDRGFSDVILWGRGAGAVAAMLYAQAAAPKHAGGGSSAAATSSYSSYFSSFDGDATNKQVGRAALFAQYGSKRAYALDLASASGFFHEVVVDTPGSIHKNVVDQRARVVDEFLAGVTMEPLTWQWVVSKPPLQITAVKPGSLAARCGARKDDIISGVSASMRLPHSVDDVEALAQHAAHRPRSALTIHVLRDAAQPAEGGDSFLPVVRPTGLILDCPIDSPGSLLDALRIHAQDREPVLVSLAEPLVSPAVDLLYHSVEKRANFDPSTIRLRDTAAALAADVPILVAVNEFYDLDRGVPNLVNATSIVYDALAKATDPAATTRQLVRYNAPLRLALRGTLDAMSSKFLNKCFVFLRTVTHQSKPISPSNEPPRWVVTTRPWAQVETKRWQETIDDYEGAQDQHTSELKLRKFGSPNKGTPVRKHQQQQQRTAASPAPASGRKKQHRSPPPATYGKKYSPANKKKTPSVLF